MKALILAAGYARRLHPLTENQAKPLLKVGHKAIIHHILDKINRVPSISEVLIVTNARFYADFQRWLHTYVSLKPITLINDGTLTNETRLGAVGDLHFVLQQEKIHEPLLVVAGDNLFGFELKQLLDFFNEKNTSVVAFHDLKDRDNVRQKYGVGILQGTKVVDFQEKPEFPKSSLASTGCYIFHHHDLHLVKESLEQGKADNPGDLVKWIVQQSEMQGFVFTEHWFDIGSHESLTEAEKVYTRLL